MSAKLGFWGLRFKLRLGRSCVESAMPKHGCRPMLRSPPSVASRSNSRNLAMTGIVKPPDPSAVKRLSEAES